jgi:hypothetical protein
MIMAVMGAGKGSEVGHVVRTGIVVSRMNEGEITLNMKSALSTTTLDVTNMAVVVSSVMRRKRK